MRDLAEAAAKHLPSADQARWLDRLSEDHDNLAAALRWAIDAGEVELAQRLSWATWRYWQFGGHLRLGRTLADAVLDMPRADEPSPGRMWSIAAAAGMAYWQADTSRASSLYRAQLETALQIGDRDGEADANWNLAATETILADRTKGEPFLFRARELYRDIGDEIGLARTDWAMANIAMMDGRLEEALALASAARQRYHDTGDVMYEALAAGTVAFTNQIMGNKLEALRAGIETIRLSRAIRDVATSTISLADGAILLVDFERHDEAAIALAAFDHLCDIHGVQPPAGIGQLILASRVEQRAFAALSSEAHANAIRRGRSMTLDEAIAFIVNEFEVILAEHDEDRLPS
jgi:hypothetical protein